MCSYSFVTSFVVEIRKHVSEFNLGTRAHFFSTLESIELWIFDTQNRLQTTMRWHATAAFSHAPAASSTCIAFCRQSPAGHQLQSLQPSYSAACSSERSSGPWCDGSAYIEQLDHRRLASWRMNSCDERARSCDINDLSRAPEEPAAKLLFIPLAYLARLCIA